MELNPEPVALPVPGMPPASQHPLVTPAAMRRVLRRGGTAEFARFRSIAMGPESELEYHLLLERHLTLDWLSVLIDWLLF
mgnify:CR=1 FL=1